MGGGGGRYRSMLSMENLPNKMSSSSLLHPVGKDYRQPRVRDHRKVSTVDWLAKTESPPPWRHACTPWTTFLCCVIKGNDFQFLITLRITKSGYFIITILLVWLSPLVLSGKIFSGIITNLFVSKSQLPFFKISHLPSSSLTCSLLSWCAAWRRAFDHR